MNVIQFDNVSVYNFMNAIRGMRNSFESWDRMDSTDYLGDFKFGSADYTLAMKLAKAGVGHDKFLRQIDISVDITAPLKWWDEVDQYHFFTTNSTSSMHTLGKDYIHEESFSFEDLDEDIKDQYMFLLNEARDRWETSGKKKPSREWRQMIMLTAMGFNYRRTFTSNYGQLKSMYNQRRNHRLSEWTGFREFVESLPYSELITLKEGE